VAPYAHYIRSETSSTNCGVRTCEEDRIRAASASIGKHLAILVLNSYRLKPVGLVATESRLKSVACSLLRAASLLAGTKNSGGMSADTAD
jgi:hypothetical protein